MKYLVALLLLALSACAQVEGVYDLNTMPTYNAKEADNRYKVIKEAQGHFEQTIQSSIFAMAGAGREPTDEQTAHLSRAVDRFLWHISAARIELFHGHYERADKSAALASQAVDDIVIIVQQVLSDPA